jgi:predicted Ser/Thr protein kinase
MLSTDLQPGQVIAGYRIERLLGRGAMGVVYLAEQTNLSRWVAFKVLYDENTRDADFIERFLNEARAAAALYHPGIVQAYDAGRVDGLYYFAMEYVSGRTLLSWINEYGRLTIDDSLRIAADLAEVLAYGWDETQLIHGDIKPDNIMIDNRGRTKLMDFGLAMVSHTERTGGPIMLTPLYAAPELIRGDTPGDIGTDIYAFGATLYHMLAGHPPFPGSDAQDVMRRHLDSRPTPLYAFFPDIPMYIATFVDRLIRKDPSERFSSWHEIRAYIVELKLRYEKEGDEMHQLAAHVGAQQLENEKSMPLTALATGRWRMNRPLRRWLKRIMLVLLVLSALAVGYFWNHHEETVTDPGNPVPPPSPAVPATEIKPAEPAVVWSGETSVWETPAVGSLNPEGENPPPVNPDPPAAPVVKTDPPPNPDTGTKPPFKPAPHTWRPARIQDCLYRDEQIRIFEVFRLAYMVTVSTSGIKGCEQRGRAWLETYKNKEKANEYQRMAFFLNTVLREYWTLNDELMAQQASLFRDQQAVPWPAQLKGVAGNVFINAIRPQGLEFFDTRRNLQRLRWSEIQPQQMLWLCDRVFSFRVADDRLRGGYLAFLLHNEMKSGRNDAVWDKAWNNIADQRNRNAWNQVRNHLLAMNLDAEAAALHHWEAALAAYQANRLKEAKDEAIKFMQFTANVVTRHRDEAKSLIKAIDAELPPE